MNVVHMAEYLTPGIVVPEEYQERLDARSPSEALSRAPDNAYCFVLYDLPDAEGVEAPEGFKLVPQRRDVSDRYYIGGKVYTLEQVTAMGPDKDILASNMHSNGWSRVVHCRTGNWQPLGPGDVVL